MDFRADMIPANVLLLDWAAKITPDSDGGDFVKWHQQTLAYILNFDHYNPLFWEKEYLDVTEHHLYFRYFEQGGFEERFKLFKNKKEKMSELFSNPQPLPEYQQ